MELLLGASLQAEKSAQGLKKSLISVKRFVKQRQTKIIVAIYQVQTHIIRKYA